MVGPDVDHPTSSPMITRMLGFFAVAACAWALEMPHVRKPETAALPAPVFGYQLLDPSSSLLLLPNSLASGSDGGCVVDCIDVKPKDDWRHGGYPDNVPKWHEQGDLGGPGSNPDSVRAEQFSLCRRRASSPRHKQCPTQYVQERGTASQKTGKYGPFD